MCNWGCKYDFILAIHKYYRGPRSDMNPEKAVPVDIMLKSVPDVHLTYTVSPDVQAKYPDMVAVSLTGVSIIERDVISISSLNNPNCINE